MEKEIKSLIKKELEKANLKFSKFASAHEGFAVMLEEQEELFENCRISREQLVSLWEMIKYNDDKLQPLHIIKMQENCVKLIEEAIQLAAMVEKYKCLFNLKEK